MAGFVTLIIALLLGGAVSGVIAVLALAVRREDRRYSLTFDAPEYEVDPQRGLVRWRITRGLLVARRGRGGRGYLQIEVLRLPSTDPGRAHLRVEVEVANFYPSIAHRLSRGIYDATQSRIHVIITHAFLRSLRRLDLAESRVGRLRRPG